MPCQELRGGYRKDGVIALLYAQIPGCYHFVTGNILMPSLHVTFAFIICNLSKLQTAWLRCLGICSSADTQHLGGGGGVPHLFPALLINCIKLCTGFSYPAGFLWYGEHAGFWWLALKAVTADTWSDACVGFSLSANCICDNIYWISFPHPHFFF